MWERCLVISKDPNFLKRVFCVGLTCSDEAKRCQQYCQYKKLNCRNKERIGIWKLTIRSSWDSWWCGWAGSGNTAHTGRWSWGRRRDCSGRWRGSGSGSGAGELELEVEEVDVSGTSLNAQSKLVIPTVGTASVAKFEEQVMVAVEKTDPEVVFHHWSCNEPGEVHGTETWPSDTIGWGSPFKRKPIVYTTLYPSQGFSIPLKSNTT